MTDREHALLSAYLLRVEYQIEEELDELQTRIRFRKIRVEDLVELLLCRQRLDDFKEFAAEVTALLGL